MMKSREQFERHSAAKAQQRLIRCDKVDGSAADQTACGGLAARIATVGTECREPLELVSKIVIAVYSIKQLDKLFCKG